MINRESIYQSLRSESINVHDETLLISDYVTFLHEIIRYVSLRHTIPQSKSWVYDNWAMSIGRSDNWMLQQLVAG
ncbi:unnamed protein product, partial [Rotaria sordida]